MAQVATVYGKPHAEERLRLADSTRDRVMTATSSRTWIVPALRALLEPIAFEHGRVDVELNDGSCCERVGAMALGK
jgi:hypothetical protein